MAAEGERRPHHRRHRDPLELPEIGDDRRVGDPQPARFDGALEEVAVLRARDRLDAGADELDPELAEDALALELQREVQCGLAAHRRQERVGPFAPEHAGDAFEIERLDVGGVGEAGVGHDRGGVRVDDDRPEALLAQHLQRLAAGVVELAGLPDHDRPGADQADRMQVVTPRHGEPPRPSRP